MSANGRWLPLVSRCRRGRKTQNQTSQSLDGSRRQGDQENFIEKVVWPGLDKRQPSSPQVPICLLRCSPDLSVTRVLDLADVDVVDSWRLEVVVDGFSLWHGAQFAIDTTLVSFLHSNGSARRRAADHDSERTCPELVGGGRGHVGC